MSFGIDSACDAQAIRKQEQGRRRIVIESRISPVYFIVVLLSGCSNSKHLD